MLEMFSFHDLIKSELLSSILLAFLLLSSFDLFWPVNKLILRSNTEYSRIFGFERVIPSSLRQFFRFCYIFYYMKSSKFGYFSIFVFIIKKALPFDYDSISILVRISSFLRIFICLRSTSHIVFEHRCSSYSKSHFIVRMFFAIAFIIQVKNIVFF